MKSKFFIFLSITSLALLAVVGVSLTAMRKNYDTMAAVWQQHHEECLRLPEEVFHLDRSRAVRGSVRGPDGKPVGGALVQCLSVSSLLRFARSRTFTPENWADLVETETRTDARGNYEFPHLSEGCRTLCASAAGLAPETQSLVLVQDGAGAWVDFKLAASRSLRIRLDSAYDRPLQIGIVPHRWWPELMSRKIAAGETVVDLPGLGGPYERGLVYIADPTSPRTDWELKSAFDLTRSCDLTVSRSAGFVASPAIVPEAECVLAWQSKSTEASRLFFGMLTPLALFWHTAPSPDRPVDGRSREPIASPNSGRLRGFGAGPFLPVLIESREGGSWLEWTTAAAEFELPGIPAGLYKVRAMHSLGKVSFARGLVVSAPGAADMESLVNQCIELDEPLSREVMGTVRWEDGRAAVGAVVYLQDASDFRRYLQRVEADANGFYTFTNVPPNAQYVIFSQNYKDKFNMKNFEYFSSNLFIREIWVDLVLSPHRIVGQLPSGGGKRQVDLLREEPGNEPRVLWSVESTPAGRFEITNVPHGRYLIRSINSESGTAIVSLPCMVEQELTAEVGWVH